MLGEREGGRGREGGREGGRREGGRKEGREGERVDEGREGRKTKVAKCHRRNGSRMQYHMWVRLITCSLLVAISS